MAACIPLNPYELSVLNELNTVMRDGPTYLCSYDGTVGVTSPCGPMGSGSAAYCPSNDSIAYDFRFMNQQAIQHGDFAPVAILAHEWGHLNQQRLGRLSGGSNIGLELHADCQAGVFAALEEVRGFLDVGDVCEAFRSLCMAGDPAGMPWFAPGTHGTCDQRVSSFERGYRGTTAALAPACGAALVVGSNPLDLIVRICG